MDFLNVKKHFPSLEQSKEFALRVEPVPMYDAWSCFCRPDLPADSGNAMWKNSCGCHFNMVFLTHWILIVNSQES